MKHLEIFESFTHLNEGSLPDRDLERKEADAARAIDRLKYVLLKYGIGGSVGIESAKSISWTKTEISELVKKSEDNFDEMKEMLKDYDDNKLPTLKKEDMDRMRAALRDKSKTLNAIKDLPVR